jgi:hypothetical protein
MLSTAAAVCLLACLTLVCNMKGVEGSDRETGQEFDCPYILTELRASQATTTLCQLKQDEPNWSSAWRNKGNIQDFHRDNL